MQVIVGTERVDPFVGGYAVAALIETGRVKSRTIHETFRKKKDVSGLQKGLQPMLGAKNIDRFSQKFPGPGTD